MAVKNIKSKTKVNSKKTVPSMEYEDRLFFKNAMKNPEIKKAIANDKKTKKK